MNQQEYRHIETISSSLASIKSDIGKLASLADKEERYQQQNMERTREAVVNASKSLDNIQSTMREFLQVANKISENNAKLAENVSAVAKALDELKGIKTEMYEIRGVLSKLK